MKKILSFILSISMMTLCSFSAHAATLDICQKDNGVSFEINDIVEFSQIYGICADRAITRVPVELELGNALYTDLIVEIAPKVVNNDSGVLNFSVSGNFYRISDNVTVTVYGLSGSFEYTGSDTSITGGDSYHNSTLDGWTGTSRTSTTKESDSQISVLKGDFTLYLNNKENNTAWIRIAVNEKGMYAVGGDYVSYDVN